MSSRGRTSKFNPNTGGPHWWRNKTTTRPLRQEAKRAERQALTDCETPTLTKPSRKRVYWL